MRLIAGRSHGGASQFREKLGKLSRALKGSLKDRTDFALIPFQELIRESSVSEEFAHNALDAALIRNKLGRVGPAWDGERPAKVPNDFGLAPI
jgi:hypothetical protein